MSWTHAFLHMIICPQTVSSIPLVSNLKYDVSSRQAGHWSWLYDYAQGFLRRRHGFQPFVFGRKQVVIDIFLRLSCYAPVRVRTFNSDGVMRAVSQDCKIMIFENASCICRACIYGEYVCATTEFHSLDCRRSIAFASLEMGLNASMYSALHEY